MVGIRGFLMLWASQDEITLTKEPVSRKSIALTLFTVISTKLTVVQNWGTRLRREESHFEAGRTDGSSQAKGKFSLSPRRGTPRMFGYHQQKWTVEVHRKVR